MIYTAKHFRIARAALGWSQGRAATEAGIGQTVVSRAELAGPENMRAENVRHLVAAYKKQGLKFTKNAVSWGAVAAEAGTGDSTRPPAEPRGE